MLYKHKRFTINTKIRKIYDEHNRVLRITGNAYRVFVFLCRNGPSTVTQIGDHLDHAKDYRENHIRQYRYKINTVLSADIVKYENKMYFITGNVQTLPEWEADPNEKRSSFDPPTCKGNNFCLIIILLLITVLIALFCLIIKHRKP